MSQDIVDPAHIARDSKMIATAIRQGWDIPAEIVKTLPKAMADIATSEEQKSSDRIAAAKVLMAMKDRNDRHGRPKKPRPQNPASQTIVIMDGNIDEAKRGIAEAITERLRLCENSAGGGTDSAPAG